jgi:pimeloyl-ACP methyl ester carboxylesterase
MEVVTSDSGGGGPAVVLLHGQPGSGADLDAVARELAPRARVIVPDRPGYGRTGGEATGFAGNARAVFELMDRLDVASATFAGHSWGAGLALAAAQLDPARVGALALISPVTPAGRFGPLDRLLADERVGPPLLRAGFGLAGHSLSLRPLRELAARSLPGVRYEDLVATARAWRREPVWRSFFVEQRALMSELPALAPALPAIHKPVTVLIGSRDRVVTPRDAMRLASLLPGARFVRVGGAGHLLPQQRPELVAREIEALAPPSRSSPAV